jgi:hypothetical protein
MWISKMKNTLGANKNVQKIISACSNATTLLQNSVNTCWNLTLSPTAAQADICSCWSSPQLPQLAAAVKSCDCKLSFFFFRL